MKKQFAKIFESEKYGQLLVLRDDNDDLEPQVKLTMDPDMEGIGLCSASITFETEESQQTSFSQFSLRTAERMADELHKTLVEIRS